MARTFFSFLILALLPCLSSEAAPKKRHRNVQEPLPNQTSQQLVDSAVDPKDKAGAAVNRKPARPDAGAPKTGSPFATEGKGGAGSVATAPCQTGIPIETFMQISSAYAPQLGKAGVYFLSDLRNTPEVFLMKSPGSWPEQISFFPDGVPFYSVSPDGTKLLIATQVGGDEQYDIYLHDTSMGHTLTPLIVDRTKRVESIAWGPKSDSFAFTSNARNKIDFDLYRFDLKTAKTTLLSELSGSNHVTDVSPNGKLIAFTSFRSITDSDLWVWDEASAKAANLTNSGGKEASGSGYFSADSRSLFYLSDRGGDIRQLYLFNLANSQARPLRSEKGDVEEISINKERSELAYLVHEEGYSRVLGLHLDPKGKSNGPLSVPEMKKSVIRDVSVSPGRGNQGFFFSESSSSMTSNIWEWKNGHALQWTKSTQALIPMNCFVEAELVYYPTFDDERIPGFLFRPKGTDSAVPFIVYAHGGPESQYRPAFSRNFQYFLQRGFGVFAPNIRGSSGYGRQYTVKDNYKLRMDSVKDVLAGAKWLIDQGHTKAGQLSIYGGSYGGFLVLRSIEEAPDLFSAASESVGISNFVTFLKNTKSYRRALREIEYGPLSDETFLHSISPMTHVDKIKTPLLIFHGANDPRVPVSETEQITAALKKRDVPVETKIFSDEGHGNSKLSNILEQARLMAHFFETQRKAD